jgi:KinB signaling pathway activation protein
VNSRKLVYLFVSTLLLGGFTTALVGVVRGWDEYIVLLSDGNVIEFLSVLFWFIGVGFIFSLISQMGYFAYLTVHRFGLGIFKSTSLWNAVQLVLVFFVLFDLVYFRYEAFRTQGESLLTYMIPALLIAIYSSIIAYIKQKETSKEAFIPALFFLVVVTILEWFPVLRINEVDWLYLMIIPLLLCNTWQLLILHRLVKKS